MDAPAPQGRRQGRWWTPRWGYPNPGRGTPRGREALRYAGPPFRYVSYGEKAQGRKHRPTVGLRAGGTVRGCCDGPLKESESAGGAAVRSNPARQVPARESPAGVETPCGSDATHVRPSGPGSESPERRATPREGRSSAVTRSSGSHQPLRLRRAAAARTALLRQASLGPGVGASRSRALRL
jgi:hypothetical protein